MSDSRTVRIWGVDAGDFVGGNAVWSVLNALKPAKKAPPEIVDLSELLLARPYCTAAIAALGLLAEGSARLVLPDTHEARDYVVRSGLIEFYAGMQDLGFAESPRSARVRRLESVSPTFSDEISEAWEREFGGMPAGLRPLLANHLDEMILNALSHSDSAIGCVVEAQVYPKVPSVEIAVLDLGQTILGHMSKAIEHADVASDQDAIIRATGEGVTGTAPGQVNKLGDPNSGIGLFELRDYCESGGGEFTIISGDAIVTFGREPEPVVRLFAGGFPGCLVSMQFNV